jgi:hypothetical protein
MLQIKAKTRLCKACGTISVRNIYLKDLSVEEFELPQKASYNTSPNRQSYYRCFDSDRLDLWSFGFTTSPHMHDIRVLRKVPK